MMLIYTFYDTIKYSNALIHINQLIKSNRKHFSIAANCTYFILDEKSKRSQQLDFQDFSA